MLFSLEARVWLVFRATDCIFTLIFFISEKIMGFSSFPQNYHKKTRKTRIFPISPMLKIFLVFQNSFFWFLWVSDLPRK